VAADETPQKGQKPSPEQAYRIYLESGRPSLRELEKVLAAKKLKVDSSTLSRWANKNPTWIAQIVEKANPIDPVKVISALEKAKEHATELCPEHFMGVKAQLVARLSSTIDNMQIDNVDDWYKALEACDRLEALIHAERGKAVSDNDPIAFPRGAKSSLLSRLDPPVKLAEFKKPNGGAA